MSQTEIPRLSRLTAIVTALQAKRMVTATELANRFQVSVRTIYRDIRALEASGIPIFTYEGQGYGIMAEYRLPPVMFTEAEANALITAEQMIAKNKDASLVKAFSEAIDKIRSVMRGSEQEKVDLLAQRIHLRQNLESEQTSNNLSQLQMAITNFRLVKIEYLSLGKDELSSRIIEPFALFSTQENWILIAFCRLRKDFRAFRLDRIQGFYLLSEHFEPHGMSLQEYFNMCREKSIPNP